jgi:peptide/nickel transport system substrate-binding protein
MPNPSVELMAPTTSDAQKIAQVVQSMVKEAGIREDPLDRVLDLADLADKYQYDAYVLACVERPRRSGRQHLQLRRVQAAAQLRRLLQARGRRDPEPLARSSDPATQEGLRGTAAMALNDRPIVYLYHRHWVWAYTNKLSGLRTVPDGLVRMQGLKFN